MHTCSSHNLLARISILFLTIRVLSNLIFVPDKAYYNNINLQHRCCMQTGLLSIRQILSDRFFLPSKEFALQMKCQPVKKTIQPIKKLYMLAGNLL